MITMSSASVLIIDDEPVVRESLAMDLRRGGYDLFFAKNGAEGINMVSDVTPAVIILDLRMR
jgi:CheY-like chemotaxis protein